MAMLAEKISELNGWDLVDDGNAIQRSFEFNDFDHAWSFMEQIAQQAKEADHHPDWSNSYNKVSIKLTSHSAGGLTDKDIEMARFINGISA